MLKRASIFAMLAVVVAVPVGANPEGGQVAAGSASIAGQGSPTVTVNQASNTAIINWQSFSIGAGEATQFLQPSSTSATLNRVLGGQTSIIDGTLSANGRIFLLNGNGILVGQNGVITTAGFTGSTRDISDSDFLSGDLHFVGSSDGGVTNYGKISALGGDVVLIGKTVDNEGTITASGTAALAAGDDVLLAQMNADGSTVTVNPVASPTPAADKVGVKNSGTIKASAAELKAANGNIYALAIQNEGLVQATTVKEEGGHIFLTSDAGTIVNSGTLDASATVAKGHGGTILVKSTAGKVVHSGRIIAKGGQGGTGGNVEVSGNQVVYSGTVDLTAPGGTTGDFLLDPASLMVVSGANNSGDIDTETDPYTNNSSSSTITNGSVINALSGSNLTLSAENSITIATGADITWTSGSTLTLQTTTAGSTIAINAAISGVNGGLTLNAAGPTDAITTSLAGTINVGSFILASGAWKQLIDVNSNGGNLPQTMVDGSAENILPAFTASNDFEIQNGTFLRASQGNGGSNAYQLEDIYGVQGMAGFLTSNFTGNGNYIDASVTSNWNGGAGFSPIGSLENPYQGSLDYLYLEYLTINRPSQDYVGLLGVLGNNGSVESVAIFDATVTGRNYVGTLVGENRGEIDYSSASYGSVTGNQDVGGLIGYQDSRSSGITYSIETGTGSGSGTDTGDNNDIYTSDATVTDESVTGNSYVGGLVGETASLIEYSTVTTDTYSPTTVTGNYCAGGVAGYIDSAGSVTYTTFEGAVQNDDSTGESAYFGGIAGYNDGTITNSNVFPNSSITGDEYVGGLAGYNDGFIADCYNSGSVTGVAYEGEEENDGGNAYIGGLVGENENPYSEEEFLFDSESPSSTGTIQTSYNTGAVSGGTYVGGLVGYNGYQATITTAYNVGSVTGDSNVGGIAGYNDGYITYVYNSGYVSGSDTGSGTGTGTDTGTGTSTVGDIVGFGDYDSDVEQSYWDASTGNQSHAIGTDNGYQNNVVPVDSTTAYTIAGNNNGSGNDGDGTGYSYFGTATAVSGTNGVYSITPDEGSPDGGGVSWYIIEGQTRPMLGMEANGSINNPHSLQLIAVDLNNTYDITHNIDMSVTGNPSEVWNSAGQGFVPIGADPNIPESGNVAFNGSIYGEYYTISSLFIDRPGSNNVGLIGYAGTGSEIYDVYLNNSSVTGNDNVGALLGTNYGYVYYAQSSNSGEDAGLVTGSENVGGIVGDNFGTVDQSSLTSSVGAAVVTGGENIGGIAGNNEEGATLSQDLNSGNITTSGSTGSSFGGIAGINSGTVSQSINYGGVGSGVEAHVGGLVGDNFGQVDDSYSGSIDGAAISGSGFVGGLVGENELHGIVETSYSVSPVQSSSPSTTGALIGVNSGTALHSYYDNETAGQEVAIGTNNDTEDTNGVPADGYTTDQLTDARNFAQGASPELWDFSPKNGESQGIWAIDAYNYNGQINNGLPVLQWQYPADAQVTATNGQQDYGYQPGYSVTGNGAALFRNFVPMPTFTVTTTIGSENITGNANAGSTQEIVVSGTPSTYNNDYSYEVEYVPGTTTIVPDPVTIIANSYNISSGSPEPSYTVTYNGFQPNGNPDELNGELEFTVTPPGAADGLHTITPSGLYSSLGNYNITYVNGVLNVGTPGATQQQLTFETELQNIQDAFGKDPANGLDPIYFLIFPNLPGLGGDEAGAINDPNDAYLAYASGTSTLPAFDRLVTSGVGVVEIIDGVVIVGNPATGNPVYISNPNGGLPIDVTKALQGILSADVSKQLAPYVSH